MALNIPLPEAPPGGFYGGAKAANALTASNLANRIKAVEAEYAPFTNYANAASKMAYSQFVGPQAIANMLTNPATRGLFTPTQQQQLLNAFAQQNFGGANALANLPVPKVGGTGGFGGGIGGGIAGLIGGLLNSLVGNKNLPTQQTNQLQTQPSQGPSETTNALTQPTPESNLNAPGYGTPASTQSQNLIPSGNVGAASTGAAIQRGEKAAEAAQLGQTETQNKLWEDAIKNAKANTQTAIDLHNALDQFHTNYQKSHIKGPGTQKFDPYGLIAGMLQIAGLDVTPEQLAKTAQTDVLTLLAPLRNTGHITDANYELFSGMKLDPAMTPKAEKIMKESFSTAIDRMQEYQDFLTQIRRKNPSILAEEADSLWRFYNRQYPPYNKSKGKPNYQNQDKWDIFTTPQALSQYRETGRFKAPHLKGKVYSHPTLKNVTEEEIDDMAEKYGKTRDEVIKDLGLK